MKLTIALLMLFSISNVFPQATSVAPVPVMPPRPAGNTDFGGNTPTPAISEAPAPTTAPEVANGTTNTSTDLSFWEKLKKAPIGFAVINDMSAATNSISGVANETILGFSYKLTDKNSLSLQSSVVATDFNTPSLKTTYGGTTFGFTRSGLLTQEKYGVNLFASLKYKHLNDPDISGYPIFSAGISRTINPTLSLSSTAYWEEYLRKNSNNKLSRRRFYLIVNPTVQLTENLSVSPTMLFYNSIKGPEVTNKDSFRFAPSVDYSFTPKFSASFYWDGYPMLSSDGSLFVPSFYSKGSVGLTLSYSVL